MAVIYAQTLYTGKKVIEDACLRFENDKITAATAAGPKRPKGARTIYPVVTPAFIDAHSHIGMERSGEPSNQGEANEHADPILALNDALDSVQMDDNAFGDAVEMGVLYSCVVPGSGNIIGGLSAVIRHYAENGSEALIGRAGLKGAFGFNPMSTTDWKGSRPSTRMGAVAMLRGRLDGVAQKLRARQKTRGPRKEETTLSAEERVFEQLLRRKLRLRAHVHKSDDIASLLRLADDYHLKMTVEHAMDVHRPGILAELRRRKIPVVYGPMDSFSYKVELKHENWRNIRHLLASGVTFGLMSDHPVSLARQLLLQTRWFLRAGMTKQEAIELITRRNAEILGIQDRLGSLSRGKWASFVCWNGDPFHLTSHPVAVYGEGRRLYSCSRFHPEQ